MFSGEGSLRSMSLSQLGAFQPEDFRYLVQGFRAELAQHFKSPTPGFQRERTKVRKSQHDVVFRPIFPSAKAYS